MNETDELLSLIAHIKANCTAMMKVISDDPKKTKWREGMYDAYQDVLDIIDYYENPCPEWTTREERINTPQ